ncbi:Nn.00g002280.m01.CDS01 [Neocucurbitaria sp. VM-36]
MSQPSTPFDGADIDAFFLSIGQQQHFGQPQLQDLLVPNQQGQIPYSSNNSEVPDKHEFAFNDKSYTPLHSSNPSTISTPDFSTYSFGQVSPAYPTPGQNSPHPYPLELQQSYQSSTPQNIQTYGQRPLPIRCYTNTTLLHPTQTSQIYVRRRSLSHGDAESLASAPPNPTFVRLQVPRVTSTTPEDTKKPGPYSKHGRSVSQGPSVRGRPLKPTGIPYVLGGSPMVGGMMSTPIGTPLDMLSESETPAKHRKDTVSNITQYKPTHTLSTKSSGPVFEYMTHPNDLARSRQIIQIGAMAVVEPSKLDPRLEHDYEGECPKRMLKSLLDVEQHLQGKNGDEEVLKACNVLRNALTKVTTANHGVKVEDGDDGVDRLEAPSRVLSPEDCGLYGGAGDDTGLMAMLMKDNNRVDDSGVDDL